MLKSGLIRIDKIYSGYRNSEVEYKNAKAFGSKNFGIFIESEESIIKNIWLVLYKIDVEDKKRLINGLISIGTKWNLILIDWDLTEAFD